MNTPTPTPKRAEERTIVLGLSPKAASLVKRACIAASDQADNDADSMVLETILVEIDNQLTAKK